jgi:uncharacterized protein YgbK (DUF1537 family)
LGGTVGNLEETGKNEDAVIAVIADDLTGAAEVAGVAWRYGLSSEVQTELNLNARAELIAIDSDTRSCATSEAATRIRNIAAGLVSSSVEWLFKKTDSVLRGPIVAELEAMLQVMDLPRAILVAANPSLGRIIEGGRYWIQGKPISETDFASDPEYPAKSSSVLRMLQAPHSIRVHIFGPHENLPAQGIIVGEAATDLDLTLWAKRLDQAVLPAGSAAFFAKILEWKTGKTSQAATHKLLLSGPGTSPKETTASHMTLFVSGSASAYSRKASRRFKNQGIPVLPMPAELFSDTSRSSELIQRWTAQVVAALEGQSCASVTLDQPPLQRAVAPWILISYLLQLIEKVLVQREIRHLYVEGGATASALARHLGWKQLKVIDELGPGVVTLQGRGPRCPLLTVKPGSYPWPENT